MTTFRDLFVSAASDVADEFYPKGDKRRGEFLRDQAMLYLKLLQNITKDDIGKIGSEMASQDNRSTQYVMFVIQVDDKDYVGSDMSWEHKERRDLDYIDEDDLCDSCKALYSDDKELPDDCENWECDGTFAYYNVEQRFDLTPGVFFTAQACEDHIKANHYHYNNPRSYGVSAWRNDEVQTIQRLLLELSGNDLPSHYQ